MVFTEAEPDVPTFIMLVSNDQSVATVFTGLAGILHHLLVQYFIGFDSNISIFFVVTGIAQLFWVIPLIRGWG